MEQSISPRFQSPQTIPKNGTHVLRHICIHTPVIHGPSPLVSLFFLHAFVQQYLLGKSGQHHLIYNLMLNFKVREKTRQTTPNHFVIVVANDVDIKS